MEARRRDVKRLPHHEQSTFCTTRSPYRQGRQLTAVKVYTVNDESQHLIVSGVPALGLQDDLRKLCCRYGDVKSLSYVPNYSTEKFVDAYHVQFVRIQSARFAKRQLDGRSFFGEVLHVCYAPEMETISETRNKLLLRRRDIAKRCSSDRTASYHNSSTSVSYIAHDSQGHAISVMESASGSCVWNGKETKVDPRTLLPAEELEKASSMHYGPQPRSLDWTDVGVREISVVALPKGRHKDPKELTTHSKPTPIDKRTNSAPLEDHTAKAKLINAVPPVLRLVPSQVKQAQKKMVFHPKNVYSSSLSSGNKSLDDSIQSVREKIRTVSVPNVQVLLDRNKSERSSFEK